MIACRRPASSRSHLWLTGALLLVSLVIFGIAGSRLLSGLALPRPPVTRWVVVSPQLQPAKANLWELSYGLCHVPDGDTWTGCRMRRAKLGVVSVYWW